MGTQPKLQDDSARQPVAATAAIAAQALADTALATIITNLAVSAISAMGSYTAISDMTAIMVTACIMATAGIMGTAAGTAITNSGKNWPPE